jgi:integrase
MAIYKRGKTWWYKFQFAGQLIRESAKSTSRTIARAAEQARKRELEHGFNGITKSQRAQIVSLVADSWLKAQSAHLSPRTVLIERTNLKHPNPFFGRKLLCDITPDQIAQYQSDRLKAGAAPKTVNLEIGTLRAILRKNRLWANIQPDVKMLRVNERVGRCITQEEETRLLSACRESRSRSLYPAVTLALNTCMRYSEIRLLRWEQIDLHSGALVVGTSKTDFGTGRTLPLNERALTVLRFWWELFPQCMPEHFVFPAERYGAAGNEFTACTYDSDPSRPIGRWKEAWEAAKARAKVVCRFHDLRHTGCTRMLEGGVPFSVVAEIMGWSPSTTIRMAKRYGHIGQSAQRHAVALLSEENFDITAAQKWALCASAISSRTVN